MFRISSSHISFHHRDHIKMLYFLGHIPWLFFQKIYSLGYDILYHTLLIHHSSYTAIHANAAAIPVVLFVAKTVKLVDPILPTYMLVVLVGV